MSITAMKLALEALENSHTAPGCTQWGLERKAAVRLRAAIAADALTALNTAPEAPAPQPAQRSKRERELECVIADLTHECQELRAAQRQPLTYDQVFNAIYPFYADDRACHTALEVFMDEYRAIEAAHGIKENT